MVSHERMEYNALWKIFSSEVAQTLLLFFRFGEIFESVLRACLFLQCCTVSKIWILQINLTLKLIWEVKISFCKAFKVEILWLPEHHRLPDQIGNLLLQSIRRGWKWWQIFGRYMETIVVSEQALTFQNSFFHHVRKAAYHTSHHGCRTLCYNLFHPTSLQLARKECYSWHSR